MKLFYDKPKSQDVENVLKRAKQMVDFRWTPIGPYATVTRMRDSTGAKQGIIYNFTRPYMPLKGIPYSSVRIHEKYVGYNVSFETFVSTLRDPRSIVYTAPQHGLGKGMGGFYGSVCSGFVSYAFDLPYRMNCLMWPQMKGVVPIPSDDFDKLQLCDILICPLHIMMITGIARDENGHVKMLEISEEVGPQCRAVWYTPEEVRGVYLKQFTFIRYEGLGKVTYTPSPYVYVEGDPELPEPHFNPSILPHYGEKANYERGETVILHALEDGWTEVAVTFPDGSVKTLPLEDNAASLTPMAAGYYSAVCKNGAKTSEPTHFAVTAMKLKTEKDTYAENEPLSLTVENPTGEKVFAYIINNQQFNGKRQGFLPDCLGKIELEGLPVGMYNLFVVAKNDYGCFRSTRVQFTVEA